MNSDPSSVCNAMIMDVFRTFHSCLTTILNTRQSNFVVLTVEGCFFVSLDLSWQLIFGLMPSTIPTLSVSQNVFNTFLISLVSFVSFKKTSPTMIRFETTFVSHGELLVGPERSRPNLLLIAVGPFSPFAFIKLMTRH